MSLATGHPCSKPFYIYGTGLPLGSSQLARTSSEIIAIERRGNSAREMNKKI
jgi:hypothetical protein